MNKEFLIWTAAFWESEGSLRLIQYSSCLSICQNDTGILEEIKRITRMGRVKSRPDRPKTHDWIVTKRGDIIFILHKLIPYMRFRKDEAKRKLRLIEKADLAARCHGWTERELVFLKKNWKRLPDEKLAKHLTRHSVGSIGGKRFALGLVKFHWRKQQCP